MEKKQRKPEEIHQAATRLFALKEYHKDGPISSSELAAYFLEIFTNGVFK